MAQIFTGGRSVFFFLAENFLHTNPVCQPQLSRAGNSNSGSLGTCYVDYVAMSLTLVSEERRCQIRPRRARVLDG